jgi:CRISPR-associated protein Cas1
LLVRKQKRELFRIPIGDLTTVYLEGKGLALSADLTMRLCEADIPVIFTPLIGVPSAIAQPVQSMRSNVRQQQVLRREDPDIIKVGFGMLAAKVANQASVLKYFARYRKRTDAAAYGALTRSADEVRDIAATLDCLDPGASAARALGMGHEGRAAAKYWTSLATLLPGELLFPGRQTRHATDPVNSALNYVYSMLYGEVWRSLLRAGLDPYFGIMHGSQRDQGSLVFDIIEEFRAPFADRVVVGMLGRGFDLELDAEGRLRSGCRHKLVSAFHKQWHRAVRWRRRMQAPSDILDAQATCLRNTFLRSDEYRPFRFQW